MSKKPRMIAPNFSIDAELYILMEGYVANQKSIMEKETKKKMTKYLKDLSQYHKDKSKPPHMRKVTEKPKKPSARYSRSQFIEEAIREKLERLGVINEEGSEQACQ